MASRFRGLSALLIGVLVITACDAPQEIETAAAPDVIFINADVYTGIPNDHLLKPTAVGVRNGEIVYVGPTTGALTLASELT